jgi:hypothetical protein
MIDWFVRNFPTLAVWLGFRAGTASQRSSDQQAAVVQQAREDQAIAEAEKSAPTDSDALVKRLRGEGV